MKDRRSTRIGGKSQILIGAGVTLLRVYISRYGVTRILESDSKDGD